jgi:hypothetical protein
MSFKHLFSVVLTSTMLLSYGCQQGREANNENQETAQDESQLFDLDQQEPTKVSDEDLAQFVEAVQKIQPLSMNAQQEMMQAVQGAGMEPQRFSEIMQSQQMPEGSSDLEISADEMAKYEKAQKEVEAIQEKVTGEMENSMKEVGITMERYEEILAAVQQDPAMMEKVQNMMNPEPPVQE